MSMSMSRALDSCLHDDDDDDDRDRRTDRTDRHTRRAMRTPPRARASERERERERERESTYLYIARHVEGHHGGVARRGIFVLRETALLTLISDFLFGTSRPSASRRFLSSYQRLFLFARPFVSRHVCIFFTHNTSHDTSTTTGGRAHAVQRVRTAKTWLYSLSMILQRLPPHRRRVPPGMYVFIPITHRTTPRRRAGGREKVVPKNACMNLRRMCCVHEYTFFSFADLRM